MLPACSSFVGAGTHCCRRVRGLQQHLASSSGRGTARTAHSRDVRARYASSRPGEGAVATTTRRKAESSAVADRTRRVTTMEEFQAALAAAEDKLVVVEVMSDVVCQFSHDDPLPLGGLPPSSPEAWADNAALSSNLRARAECFGIKHSFQRVARECPDVEFLTMEVGQDDASSQERLKERFGVDTLPTLQFWRNGAKLWEHRGSQGIEEELDSGVMFFSDPGDAGSPPAQRHVAELRSVQDFNRFVAGAGPGDTSLRVVNFALSSSPQCLAVYPAVVALARQLRGQASFARAMCDRGDAGMMAELMRDLGVVEVPTFLVYRGGCLIGRHVGPSRGDLIGRVLEMQHVEPFASIEESEGEPEAAPEAPRALAAIPASLGPKLAGGEAGGAPRKGQLRTRLYRSTARRAGTQARWLAQKITAQGAQAQLVASLTDLVVAVGVGSVVATTILTEF